MTDDFKLELKGYIPLTICVLYYLPDYRSLVNEFIWQTIDLKPQFPRTHKFLNHWKQEIDAVIKEVIVSEGKSFSVGRYENITEIFKH